MAKKRRKRKTPAVLLEAAGSSVRKSAHALAIAGQHGRPTQVVDASAELLLSIIRIIRLRHVDIDDVVAEFEKRTRK